MSRSPIRDFAWALSLACGRNVHDRPMTDEEVVAGIEAAIDALFRHRLERPPEAVRQITYGGADGERSYGFVTFCAGRQKEECEPVIGAGEHMDYQLIQTLLAVAKHWPNHSDLTVCWRQSPAVERMFIGKDRAYLRVRLTAFPWDGPKDEG